MVVRYICISIPFINDVRYSNHGTSIPDRGRREPNYRYLLFPQRVQASRGSGAFCFFRVGLGPVRCFVIKAISNSSVLSNSSARFSLASGSSPDLSTRFHSVSYFIPQILQASGMVIRLSRMAIFLKCFWWIEIILAIGSSQSLENSGLVGTGTPDRPDTEDAGNGCLERRG